MANILLDIVSILIEDENRVTSQKKNLSSKKDTFFVGRGGGLLKGEKHSFSFKIRKTHLKNIFIYLK